jgi:hypothetical protein
MMDWAEISANWKPLTVLVMSHYKSRLFLDSSSLSLIGMTTVIIFCRCIVCICSVHCYFTVL